MLGLSDISPAVSSPTATFRRVHAAVRGGDGHHLVPAMAAEADSVPWAESGTVILGALQVAPGLVVGLDERRTGELAVGPAAGWSHGSSCQ